MPEGIYKKAELLANVAIVVVALLLGGVLVKRYLLPGSAPPAAERPDPRVPPGTQASVPGVDWAGNGRTLLLVLSRDCRYCTQSAPFYQRLARETAGRPGLRLVALLPQPVEEGRKYLEGLGVPLDDVRQAPPASAGARATPTVLLVDGRGVVEHSWVGMLSPAEESEVLSRLAADGGSRQ